MTSRRKAAGIAALIGTGLAAGAIGAMVVGPGPAGAQTNTPTPKATTGTFHAERAEHAEHAEKIVSCGFSEFRVRAFI